MARKKTLTRADLSAAINEEVGLTRLEASEMVDAVLEEVGDALLRENKVKLSSFGTFSVRRKKARVGRNPKTGEEVTISPRRVVRFRASHVLKDRVNKIKRKAKSKSRARSRSR